MNTPNKITLSRLFIAIAMIIVYCLSFLPNYHSFAPYLGTTGFTWVDLVSACLFIIGAISDMVDGKMARKRNLVTNFGKFMDPLADKFLTDAALILLSTKTAANGSFYLYPFLTVLFIGRDLAMDGLRMMAATKGKVLAANIWGKVKTVVLMIVIPFVFLNGFPFNYLSIFSNGTWDGNFEYTYVITNVMVAIALFFSLLSMVIYFKQNWHVLKEDEKSE